MHTNHHRHDLIGSFLFLALTLGAQAMAQLIVLPQTPNAEEKKAATELQLHLQKALGKSIPILKEPSPASSPMPRFFVGNTDVARRQGLSSTHFKAEQWRLKSIGQDLILLGGAPRGTLYAVFEYLERYVNVLWLDHLTTIVPHLSYLPQDIDVQGKPSFAIRGLFAFFPKDQEARQTFFIRNRQNLFHDEGSTPFLRAWNIYPIFGLPRACHTYFDYSNAWGKEDEDCFSMTAKGVRQRSTSAMGPGQICFTNPKTVELVLKKLRWYISLDRKKYGNDHIPLIYELSANDNVNKCECPTCLAAAKKYGAYSGVVLAFTNEVARRIRPEYPNVYIQMFAYTFAEEAPSNIKAEPNVLVRIAQLGAEFTSAKALRDTMRPLSHPNNARCLKRIQDWHCIAALSIWDYLILYQNRPTVSECYPSIGPNLKLYQKLGVISYFAEVEDPAQTCFYPLRIWLTLRLLNNAQLDADALVRQFMKAYYQEAATPMTDLLAHIVAQNNTIPQNLNTLGLSTRTDMSDDFFDKADLLIRQALAQATTPELKDRILKEQLVLDLVKLNRREQLKPFDTRKTFRRVTHVVPTVKKNWFRGTGFWYEHFDKSLQKLTRRITTKRPPLPTCFPGRDIVIDLPWMELTSYSKAKLQDVPDADGGKAIVLPDDGKDKGDLQFGYWDGTTNTFTYNRRIPKSQVPQDEAFHYYHVGRITLSGRCRVWLHWSWFIHQDLEEYYNVNGSENEFDLYISVKAQGPLYVKGSKKPNALMMDRVVLLR